MCRQDPRWYGYRFSRPPVDPKMRVSDAERNEVAETLSRHFADGRLDQSEFKERLDAAMTAKTRGDLSGLTTDLPVLAPAAPVPVPRRRVPVLLIALVAFLLLSAGQWWVNGWFLVPRIPWLLIGIVGFVLWRRSRWRHREHPGPSTYV